MISQSRWDWIVDEVVFGAKLRIYLEDGELELIESVLKNNTPLQVVPDCCLGNNKQQVGKPNKETIEAMNDDAVLETNSALLEPKNILLETKHFKVLGDKE